MDLFRFGHVTRPRYAIDASSHSVVRDMNKCILCRRCVRTCIDLQEVGVLEALHRGHKTKVGTFMDKPLADVVCINCGQCINRCPTGALRANDLTDEVWEAIDDPAKHVVIQTAPSPRAGIGECFGLEPGHPLTFQMNTALRGCGFDRVFDTNFAADLTIIEEGVELLLRLYRALVQTSPLPLGGAGAEGAVLPQFTSCSPGWVKYLEHFFPEAIPHLSTAKSPQQMFGALIKTYYAELNHLDPKDIVTVALMPCSAKKFECNRPEMCASGFKDIDYGLTTRELGKMIREAGVGPAQAGEVGFRRALRHGHRLGSDLRRHRRRHGGRPAHGPGTGHGREDRVVLRPRRHHSAPRFRGRALRRVAGDEGRAGPRAAAALVPRLGLAARGDLEGGRLSRHGQRQEGDGGHPGRRPLQPMPFHRVHGLSRRVPGRRRAAHSHQSVHPGRRARAIYSEDHAYSVRKSHENPAILEVYEKFLAGGPCGHKSHELLHTSYTRRGKYIA